MVKKSVKRSEEKRSKNKDKIEIKELKNKVNITEIKGEKKKVSSIGKNLDSIISSQSLERLANFISPRNGGSNNGLEFSEISHDQLSGALHLQEVRERRESEDDKKVSYTTSASSVYQNANVSYSNVKYRTSEQEGNFSSNKSQENGRGTFSNVISDFKFQNPDTLNFEDDYSRPNDEKYARPEIFDMAQERDKKRRESKF